MKKLIAILLTLSFLMLTACGEDSEPAGADKDQKKDNMSSKPTSSQQTPVTDDESDTPVSSDTASSGQTDSTPDTTTPPQGETRPQKPYLDPNFDPTDESQYYQVDFDSWEMYLANPWNPVPDSWLNLTTQSPELAKVPQKYRPNPSQNSQLYFDKRAIDCLHAMIADAEDDGINLDVISAYRTNTFQTNNFANKVTRVMKADPSLTKEQAEIEAAKVVARPGTSEHQLGLAVDFNSVEDSFRNTKAYKWLIENCTDYGFILRYTPEKQDKTGIIPEPWHYRYVGVKNAKMIEASGLCMEEFIEKYGK